MSQKNMTLIMIQLVLNFDIFNRVDNLYLIKDQYQNTSKTGNNEAR